MPKLKVDDLAKIKERTRKETSIREGKFRAKVTVHMGTCGIASGAREIMSVLLDEIKRNHVDDVMVTTSGCAGLCSQEPMATVELKEAAPVKYIKLTPEKITEIFSSHILNGKVMKAYALAIGSERIG